MSVTTTKIPKKRLNTWDKSQEETLQKFDSWLKTEQTKEKAALKITAETNPNYDIREDRILMLTKIQKELEKHLP